MEEYKFYVSPEFPLEDFESISSFLLRSNALVAGFGVPPAGLLSFGALAFATTVEALDVVILPDRNLTTRLVKVARDGVVNQRDTPTAIALHLMALAQLMQIDIEPSISFHEFADG